MPVSSLVKKLRIQPGQRVLILNAPQGYLASLAGLPDEIAVSEIASGKYEFVHLFVKDSAQFTELIPIALTSVVYDGLFWLSYPKKSSNLVSDLSRDVFWNLMGNKGYRPVTQISIDEVWSALRFRPSEAVGRK